MSEYITLLPLLFSSLPRSLPPPLPPFYVGRHNALHPTHSPIHPFITIHKVCGDRGLFLKGTEGGRHGGAVPGDRPDHRRRSPVPRLPTERVRRAQVHRPRQRRPRRTPAVPLVRRGGRGGGSVDGVPYGPHPEAHAGTSGEYDTDRYGCNSRYNEIDSTMEILHCLSRHSRWPSLQQPAVYYQPSAISSTIQIHTTTAHTAHTRHHHTSLTTNINHTSLATRWPIHAFRRTSQMGLEGEAAGHGPMRLAAQVARSAGIRGLFSGLTPTVLKTMPSVAITKAVGDYLLVKANP